MKKLNYDEWCNAFVTTKLFDDLKKTFGDVMYLQLKEVYKEYLDGWPEANTNTTTAS